MVTPCEPLSCLSITAARAVGIFFHSAVVSLASHFTLPSVFRHSGHSVLSFSHPSRRFAPSECCITNNVAKVTIAQVQRTQHRHILHCLCTNPPTENDIKDVLMCHQKQASTRPVGSKTAFVVGNVKDHWRVRVYDTLTRVVFARWETRAFFSIEEARSWLGIKLPLSLGIVTVDVKRNKAKREVRPPAR